MLKPIFFIYRLFKIDFSLIKLEYLELKNI